MRKSLFLLAAIALLTAFTAPSFASEWNFYGQARMTTFWVDEDFGDFDIFFSDKKDHDLDHNLQSNARIGATVKVSDNLVGRFEYGTGINLRILWGEYNFGSFKLGIGQHYTPVNIFISNQVFGGDTDMLPFGGVYGGRNPMVQFKFGDFKLAFVAPESRVFLYIDPITWFFWAGADTDVKIPRIEASYRFTLGGVSFEAQGGYNTFDLVNFVNESHEVTAYILALSASCNAGPLYLAGDVFMGQNIEDLGIWTAGFGLAGLSVDLLTGSAHVLDNDALGLLFVAGFRANENLRFEAGYGQAKFDMEKSDNEDEVTAMYVQARITLAKGVFITPEIGKIDYKEEMFNNDEGYTIYYGLQSQIRF